MEHGAKMEEVVWNEFKHNPGKLAIESQQIIAKYSHLSLDELVLGRDYQDYPGETREQVVKRRINQDFFRNSVLAAYDYHCCISGIGNQSMLEACHIVDWADEVANRTNPQNGLCMNPFFHKAYDKLLVGISPDYTISVSEELIERCDKEESRVYLRSVDGKQITMPAHFIPDKVLLAIHFERYIAAN